MQVSKNSQALGFPNLEQTMTSLQIAQYARKKHKDVLESIRIQEIAWERINQRKFPLVSYKARNGQMQPMYNLNYDETMYVVSKFNDEVRAVIFKEWSALKKQQEQKELPPSAEIVMDRTMRRYATPVRYPMPSYRAVQHKNPEIKLTDGYIHLMVNVMNYQNPIPGIIDSSEKLYLDLPGILRCFSRPYHKALVDKLAKQIEPQYIINTRATDVLPARRYVHIEWVDKTFGAIYGVDIRPKNEEMQLDGYFIEMKQMLDIVKELHSPELDKSKLTHLLMNKEVHRG